MFISHSQDHIGIIKYSSHYGVGIHKGQDVTNRGLSRLSLLTVSASPFKRINPSRLMVRLLKRWSNTGSPGSPFITIRSTNWPGCRCWKSPGIPSECGLNRLRLIRLPAIPSTLPDLLSRIHDASARYDFEQVARYIADNILRRAAFADTPDEVVEQVAHLFDAGVQRVE